MTQEARLFNSFAPLRNVSAFLTLLKAVQNRGQGLPGMGTFYGPSGFGKSTAAIYAANTADACLVQMKSVWTRKKLCEAILSELSLPPAATVANMVDQISEQLAITGTPLLIDEADVLVAKKMVEIVRDIYEASFAPVILIGEELLPQKLQRWERVHGRMLRWVAAEPGNERDFDLLSRPDEFEVLLPEGREHVGLLVGHEGRDGAEAYRSNNKPGLGLLRHDHAVLGGEDRGVLEEVLCLS